MLSFCVCLARPRKHIWRSCGCFASPCRHWAAASRRRLSLPPKVRWQSPALVILRHARRDGSSRSPRARTRRPASKEGILPSRLAFIARLIVFRSGMLTFPSRVKHGHRSGRRLKSRFFPFCDGLDGPSYVHLHLSLSENYSRYKTSGPLRGSVISLVGHGVIGGTLAAVAGRNLDALAKGPGRLRQGR